MQKAVHIVSASDFGSRTRTTTEKYKKQGNKGHRRLGLLGVPLSVLINFSWNGETKGSRTNQNHQAHDRCLLIQQVGPYVCGLVVSTFQQDCPQISALIYRNILIWIPSAF
jgi:hypothetical protein